MRATHQLAPVGFPGRNLILAGHSQVNGIHHDAVPRRSSG